MRHQFHSNTRSGCCCGCCGCGNSCACNCDEYLPRGEGFAEKILTLPVVPGDGNTQNLLIAQAVIVTVFFRNEGSAPVEVWLQNSPDGRSFIDDPQRRILSSGELGYIVPYVFSKYLRAVYSSIQAGSLRIWVQVQNGPH